MHLEQRSRTIKLIFLGTRYFEEGLVRPWKSGSSSTNVRTFYIFPTMTEMTTFQKTFSIH
ncbi:CDG_1a_G0027850.mRNA.1.CDS.1 [Saccharomyces cerevisiae]|nr:CDG_1a_G0027850.mRNA.1.CDS.1 [Saccharomyces cerevisiae]CAI7344880.1 CDG_1a_G0027850.mRNA.1.CDS.1 [Saccharomyces cerevisiae]